MARVEYTSAFIVKAMQLPKTREALREKGTKLAREVDALANNEGVKMRPARTESGTRPKGRPVTSVIVPDGAGQEFGTSRTERRRILGRVAERG